MLRKVIVLFSFTLFCILGLSKTDKNLIKIKLKNGETYRVNKLEIYGNAEPDRFWYTDKDGFYVDVSFKDLVEIKNTAKGIYLVKIRTGAEKVKKIENLKFKFNNGKGRDLNVPLSDIEFIKFTTHKCDKICPLGHIFRNTDFIYCPYDGLLLKPLETEKVETIK
ncbi:hypothetical protein TTHT_0330 [Thermotomaculum hydrothermale]|uniref:Uncharacterized protein n=1 Tax=Thermotomaculum hydrothermale TaxID=981385 RepID=A0A7R6PPF2_9BACT|nr:hypothetical protein [Thermotomaculum hydrothermale]BBB31946.1 hypothetical protein TTHT_0330 [Thermotomaculum hydrothermale]